MKSQIYYNYSIFFVYTFIVMKANFFISVSETKIRLCVFMELSVKR